jgi:hypothetical protein
MKARHKATGALIAVALVIGVVGVAPAMAAEGLFGESAPPGELITRPAAPSELGSAKSGAAPASLSECSIGQVCAWSGIFTGTFSWWPESNTGCHNHASNPNLRSGYNGSNYRERVGGWGYVASHFAWESVGGSVTGELCWPA